MYDGTDWLYIDASSTRLFRVGEAVSAGETLGASVFGGVVRAGANGRVVEIQYDIDSNQIILEIAPLRHPQLMRAAREMNERKGCLTQ